MDPTDRARLEQMLARCQELDAEYHVLWAEWDRVPWWKPRTWRRYLKASEKNLNERRRILTQIAGRR